MLELSTETAVELVYFAEGAANIVYRILPRPPTPGSSFEAEIGDVDECPPTEISAPLMDPTFLGKLLRLRKDLPFTLPVLESHRQFVDTFPSLISPTHLVEQSLVKVTESLLRHCNDGLRMDESRGARPEKRRGTYLAENEPYGCLMTDMSCTSLEDEAYCGVEFKPKWLIQSPSAPQKARRCRTCALRARNSHNTVQPPDTGRQSSLGFCPLMLVSEDRSMIAQAITNIVRQKRKTASESENQIVRYITDFLHQDPLLRRLRALQLELDPKGIFETDTSSVEFLVGMTLRDCTLFFKVGSHPFWRKFTTSISNSC